MKVGAVVLAAGQSKRMGATNKLLASIDGRPIVAHVVDALIEAAVEPIVVVVGHEAGRVREALAERAVSFVENPDYTDGIGSSVRTGAAALMNQVDGALFVLGDMPKVRSDDVRRLVEAFDPDTGRSICVPVYQGRRGNPLLWASRFFEAMQTLAGDVGARSLLSKYQAEVTEVAVGDDGVHFDVDTPSDLVPSANGDRRTVHEDRSLDEGRD